MERMFQLYIACLIGNTTEAERIICEMQDEWFDAMEDFYARIEK